MSCVVIRMIRATLALRAQLMRTFRVLALAAALATVYSVQWSIHSEQAAALSPGGPFDTLHFRSVGPASMSGRISDVAVYEANPAIFYVGTAHGGVWKTSNNGTTFQASSRIRA
jgi:hypothetical protein